MTIPRPRGMSVILITVIALLRRRSGTIVPLAIPHTGAWCVPIATVIGKLKQLLALQTG